MNSLIDRRDFVQRTAASLSAIAAGCASATRPAMADTLADDRTVELILTRGRFYTVDPRDRVAEAVAIKNGHFVAVGSNEEIESLATAATRRIDLAGRSVVPGFIDGHPHMDGVGMRLILPSFEGAKSIDDILDVVRREVARRKPDEWIICNSIADTPEVFKFPGILREGRWPNREDLDRASPDNPVFIRPPSLVSPGVAVANSAALRLAGVNRDTVAPDAVEIVRDGTGQPTGVFKDMNFPKRVEATLFQVIPPAGHEQFVRALRAGVKAFNQAGITGIYEGHGIPAGPQRAYVDLWSEGALSVRTYFVIAYPISSYRDAAAGDAIIREAAKYAGGRGLGDDYLKFGGLGFSFDSASAIGACLMRQQYIGAQGRLWSGVQHTSDENFRSIMLKGARANLRMQVSCAGGAAIDKVLEVFDEINREIPITGKRWVIEHCQFPSPENMAACKRLGVIPTTCTNFIWNHGHVYVKSFGRELATNAVPFKAWLDAGLPVVQSTDGHPYEPLFTFWQSLARHDGVTGEAFTTPKQKLSRAEALRIYTANAANVMFSEDRIGSIEAGKLADFVVLSDDIMQIPEDRIPETKVLATVVGGRAVHDTGIFAT